MTLSFFTTNVAWADAVKGHGGVEPNEVTVVAPKLEALAASATLVTSRQINSVPLRTAEDALRLAPGFFLVQHGSEGKGHQFFLRGFDAMHGADLEVVVDGMPINEWSNVHGQGYLDLAFIPAEVIETVRVTPGPFLVEQGAFATAGSARYQLGIPDERRGVRASYSLGTTGRHRGVTTLSSEQGSGQQFLALEALHDDGFGENRHIDRFTALGRAELHESAGNGLLAVTAGVYSARFGLPGVLPNRAVQEKRIGFYDTFDLNGFGESDRLFVAFSHRVTRSRVRAETLLHSVSRRLLLRENYTGALFDPVNGDRRLQRHRSLNLGVQSRHWFRVSDEVELRTGVGVHGEVLRQVQDQVGSSAQFLTRERSLSAYQLMAHGWGSAHWAINREVTSDIGGRIDAAQVSAQDRMSPRASGGGLLAIASPRLLVNWQMRPKLRMALAYGHGFRPPEARAFTRHRLPPTGFSEEIHQGGKAEMTVSRASELGLSFAHSQYLGLRGSGFATLIQNESVFDHVSGLNLNLNATRRLGAELGVRSRLTPWLAFSFDATYTDARFSGSGGPVPFAPPLVAGMHALLGSENDGPHAGFRWQAVTPRPLPHGARGSAFSVLDAKIGYRQEPFTVDVEIENVLDSRVREGEYHYASSFGGDSQSQIPVLHFAAGPPRVIRLGFAATF